jgi:hypothetical protein
MGRVRCYDTDIMMTDINSLLWVLEKEKEKWKRKGKFQKKKESPTII